MGTNDESSEHYDINVHPHHIQSQILAQSMVKKKNRLRMYWSRMLILTDEPRLFYYKPNNDNKDLKQIDLDFLCKAEKVEKTKFAVITPDPTDYKKKRIYEFRCNDEKETENWVVFIQDQIAILKKKENGSGQKYISNSPER